MDFWTSYWWYKAIVVCELLDLVLWFRWNKWGMLTFLVGALVDLVLAIFNFMVSKVTAWSIIHFINVVSWSKQRTVIFNVFCLKGRLNMEVENYWLNGFRWGASDPLSSIFFLRLSQRLIVQQTEAETDMGTRDCCRAALIDGQWSSTDVSKHLFRS